MMIGRIKNMNWKLKFFPPPPLFKLVSLNTDTLLIMRELDLDRFMVKKRKSKKWPYHNQTSLIFQPSDKLSYFLSVLEMEFGETNNKSDTGMKLTLTHNC